MQSEAAQEFIAGAFAGVSSLIIGHPLDTVKTLSQNSSGKTSIKEIVNSIRQSGTSTFFRGLSLPLYSYAMVNAVLFSTYKSTLRALDPNETNFVAMGVAGFVAGGVQLVPAIPVEVVKIAMQKDAVANANQKSGVMNAVVKLVKTRGITSLYSGWAAHAARDMPACAIYFSTYSILRDHLWRTTHCGPLVSSFCAGAVSGCLSWAFTVPQDVVKTRMQAGTEKTVKECVTNLHKLGYKSFFRGFQMVFLRAFLVNAFTFLAYEVVMMELRRYKTGQIPTSIKPISPPSSIPPPSNSRSK